MDQCLNELLRVISGQKNYFNNYYLVLLRLIY